jgi:hypothetical protein
MSRAADRRRRSWRALVTLLGFLHALVVGPALHAHHHAVHGDDHVHDATGMHPLGVEHEGAGSAAAAHAELHEVFAALGLSDVAYAGTLAVDCALADYTLVECTPADEHAPAFGDALVAHDHGRRSTQPEHGRGALQHGYLLVVAAPPPVLPPVCRSISVLEEVLVAGQRTVPTVVAHDPRGPPILARALTA